MDLVLDLIDTDGNKNLSWDEVTALCKKSLSVYDKAFYCKNAKNTEEDERFL